MDYQTAQRMLPISKHRLDDELETHADNYSRVSEQLAAANTAQLRAKDELARVEARVYATTKDSGTKYTAAEIDAIVTRNALRIEAFDAFMKAREDYERWLGMAESWRQRSYTITKLGDLFSANYYSQTLTSLTDTDKRPEWQREGLAQRRATEVTPSTNRPLIKRRTA